MKTLRDFSTFLCYQPACVSFFITFGHIFWFIFVFH